MTHMLETMFTELVYPISYLLQFILCLGNFAHGFKRFDENNVCRFLTRYPEIDSTRTFVGKYWIIDTILAFLKLIAI